MFFVKYPFVFRRSTKLIHSGHGCGDGEDGEAESTVGTAVAVSFEKQRKRRETEGKRFKESGKEGF